MFGGVWYNSDSCHKLVLVKDRKSCYVQLSLADDSMSDIAVCVAQSRDHSGPGEGRQCTHN